jgi:hypothetical protein
MTIEHNVDQIQSSKAYHYDHESIPSMIMDVKHSGGTKNFSKGLVRNSLLRKSLIRKWDTFGKNEFIYDEELSDKEAPKVKLSDSNVPKVWLSDYFNPKVQHLNKFSKNF